MQEHLAVDAEEHPIIEVRGPKPWHVRVARHVSNILAPATISLPFVFLVAFYKAQNQLAAFVYACITLLFLSFGPLLYIIIGVRRGKLSDIDVSRRAERAGPFLFGILSMTIGWLVLALMNGPKNLQTVLIISAISGVVMLMITLRWKISMHASSLSGVATMLTALYGAVMLPTFMLVALVSWSRVALHRHTKAQVVAGSLVSFGMTAVILKMRGM